MSETEAKKAKVQEPTPKDVSKSRTDNPLPRTPNVVQAPEPTTSTSTIPVDLELKLMLGRMDHRWVLHDLIVNIDNQDNLATRTYDIMVSLIRVDFPMTHAQFITIWKTLLYKRVQDVYTREKGLRPPNFLHLANTIPVPAPLGDLLFAIGGFESCTTGLHLHLVPPNIPVNNPPAWSRLPTAETLNNWFMTMTKLSPLYVLRETPPAHQYMGAPLGLLGRNVNAVNRVTINSISSEPTYKDAYIRIVNDELDLFQVTKTVEQDRRTWFDFFLKLADTILRSPYSSYAARLLLMGPTICRSNF